MSKKVTAALTIETINKEIQKRERQIERLRSELRPLYAERLAKQAGLAIGDTIYYRKSYYTGTPLRSNYVNRWHAVTITSFFIYADDTEALGVRFQYVSPKHRKRFGADSGYLPSFYLSIKQPADYDEAHKK